MSPVCISLFKQHASAIHQTPCNMLRRLMYSQFVYQTQIGFGMKNKIMNGNTLRAAVRTWKIVEKIFFVDCISRYLMSENRSGTVRESLWPHLLIKIRFECGNTIQALQVILVTVSATTAIRVGQLQWYQQPLAARYGRYGGLVVPDSSTMDEK